MTWVIKPRSQPSLAMGTKGHARTSVRLCRSGERIGCSNRLVTETIAVALITAMCTLAASALSAWLILRSARVSGELQLVADREQRAEEFAAELRKTRREAYIQFLSEAIEVAAKIRQVTWSSETDDAEFARLQVGPREALNELIPTLIRVTLEGPTEVRDAANEVRDALRRELETCAEVYRTTMPRSALVDASQARRVAVGTMRRVARKTLGGDLPSA